MAKPLEHIRKHPKLAKQLIGLTLPQLEQLIKKSRRRSLFKSVLFATNANL